MVQECLIPCKVLSTEKFLATFCHQSPPVQFLVEAVWTKEWTRYYSDECSIHTVGRLIDMSSLPPGMGTKWREDVQMMVLIKLHRDDLLFLLGIHYGSDRLFDSVTRGHSNDVFKVSRQYSIQNVLFALLVNNWICCSLGYQGLFRAGGNWSSHQDSTHLGGWEWEGFISALKKKCSRLKVVYYLYCSSA